MHKPKIPDETSPITVATLVAVIRESEMRMMKYLDKRLDEKLYEKLDKKLDEKLDEKFGAYTREIKQYIDSALDRHSEEIGNLILDINTANMDIYVSKEQFKKHTSNPLAH